MSEYLDKIEAELINLIKQRENRPVSSERDKLISNAVIEKYFSGTEENQLDFKAAVEKLVFKYSNVRGSLADAVIYHLLYVCLKVKVPIDNLLTDLLKNKSLAHRYYEDKDLILLALKVLIDVPLTYRTKKELLKLFKKDSFYNHKLSFCLHFLELFGRKQVSVGITDGLDSLLDLEIDESDVRLIASQLKSTSRSSINPLKFRDWYNTQIDDPARIKDSVLNKVLLRFVEISQGKEGFEDWEEVFNLINAYSTNFILTPGSSDEFEAAQELIPLGTKAMAAAGGFSGGIE